MNKTTIGLVRDVRCKVCETQYCYVAKMSKDCPVPESPTGLVVVEGRIIVQEAVSRYVYNDGIEIPVHVEAQCPDCGIYNQFKETVFK